MGTYLVAMKRALETLEDVFGKGKVDVTAINMLREAISKSENQAYSLNTQDMKILASDFMSHPLSRGISDCEKIGEALFDAAAEIGMLRQRIDSAPVALMDTRDVLGICAPTEEDFPALYALQGKRVRLVLEEIPE